MKEKKFYILAWVNNIEIAIIDSHFFNLNKNIYLYNIFLSHWYGIKSSLNFHIFFQYFDWTNIHQNYQSNFFIIIFIIYIYIFFNALA